MSENENGLRADLVPDWRSRVFNATGTGSSLGLVLWIALVFAALVYGFWLLPVLTDWVSAAVDEGYTSYAAQRIREGAWPHRDFFFLWTPGTAYLHAILQSMGFTWLGERAAALFASLGSGLLIWRFSAAWRFPPVERGLLALLLLAWSFPLWNIPYSSWYAVFFALLALTFFPRHIFLAGLLWGTSFWFKQNIGILSLLGALAWLVWRKERSGALKLAALFAAALILPFTCIAMLGGKDALLQALRQIFLFPLAYPGLMSTGPAPGTLAAPLTSLGLWILGFFFLRAGDESKSGRLLQLGVLAYISYYVWRAPGDFLLAGLLLISLAAWPVSAVLACVRGKGEESARFFSLWLPCMGIFLQAFPRIDFQHLLFVFPLSAFFLLYGLKALRERYPRLPLFWVRLPALLLLVGGICLQADVVQTRRNETPDSLGRISKGSGRRLNEEVTAVWRFLRDEGLKEGDPILVLPNATALYRWTGFRNLTPHQQFFPGYVEAFGQSQSDVLPLYRAAGGRFLVVQERSGLETDVPEIHRQIQTGYSVAKSFPGHFTIYAPLK